MATIEPAPRRISQQRTMLTSLPLYYEGFVWIKRPRSKEAKYWTELRGTKLFLYNDKKQEKYIDSIELRNLKSVNDGHSNQKQWSEVVLTLDKEEVIIKTEIAEDAEEWKGFILTVVEQSVPSWLTLLPGQLIRLKEVLEKETARRAEEKGPLVLPSRMSVDVPSSEAYEDVAVSNAMPMCFYSVSRHEAAEMLVKNESFGNLILRPGGDSKNYAVTIREPSENSRSQVKHYRILKTDRGFTIELDKPVILNSLDDVVDHFIRETRGKLKPYVSNIYDTQIDYAVNVETQKTADKFMPAQRGAENTYVNVDAHLSSFRGLSFGFLTSIKVHFTIPQTPFLTGERP
ncbi:PREDICTED: signal-transducing adaptor protein 1 [Nanorana parkeri]|uniref:signal-transducing adaptor protein 1 n=1 Tax=Nanorana parkeri TaxID=125878 RepID=UPI00085459CA|nr:PREDICTED: signal-transducing adaptor protein 1 [Nanorana parkeri]